MVSTKAMSYQQQKVDIGQRTISFLRVLAVPVKNDP
jgi:hypothetical protein